MCTSKNGREGEQGGVESLALLSVDLRYNVRISVRCLPECALWIDADRLRHAEAAFKTPSTRGPRGRLIRLADRNWEWATSAKLDEGNTVD